MAIVEKNKVAAPAVIRNDGDAVDNVPLAPKRKASPRTSFDLSQWDNINRVPDNDERDRYFVPPHLIPDGFSVEWKRMEILGKPDRKNLVQVETAGWRPAPADLFKEMLPSGYSGEIVEDGEGMMLMIRPTKFSEEAKVEAYNNATQKVKDYENATMNRVTGHKDVPSKVTAFSRSYEKDSVKVPD